MGLSTLSKVRIWRDTTRSHIWWCTRVDIEESRFNPVASGHNAGAAYENYKLLLS